MLMVTHTRLSHGRCCLTLQPKLAVHRIPRVVPHLSANGANIRLTFKLARNNNASGVLKAFCGLTVRACTAMFGYVHAYGHARRACMRVCGRERAHVCVCVCVCAYVHAYVHASVCACVCACVCAYV